MVDVPLAAFWRALWNGPDRPGDEPDDVQLLAAACFWQDPRIAPRRAR